MGYASPPKPWDLHILVEQGSLKHKEASCWRHCTPAIMQAFVPRPLDSPGVPASKLAVLSAADQDASECTFPSGAFWCASSSRNESQIKEWEFLFITSFFMLILGALLYLGKVWKDWDNTTWAEDVSTYFLLTLGSMRCWPQVKECVSLKFYGGKGYHLASDFLTMSSCPLLLEAGDRITAAFLHHSGQSSAF